MTDATATDVATVEREDRLEDLDAPQLPVGGHGQEHAEHQAGGHREEHVLDAVPEALAEVVAGEHVGVLLPADVAQVRALRRCCGTGPGGRAARRDRRRTTPKSDQRRGEEQRAPGRPPSAVPARARRLPISSPSRSVVDGSKTWTCSGATEQRDGGARPRAAAASADWRSDEPAARPTSQVTQAPRGRATRRGATTPVDRRRRRRSSGARAGRRRRSGRPSSAARRPAGPGSGSSPDDRASPPSIATGADRCSSAGVPMKRATNRLAGRVVDLAGRADLLEAAGGHDRDAVGHRHGLDLVVGDVDEGGRRSAGGGRPARPGSAARSLASRFDSGSSIRNTCGRAHDGPGQRHPLALAAGERGRLAVEVAARGRACGRPRRPARPARPS